MTEPASAPTSAELVQELDDRSFLAGRAFGPTRESREKHRASQETKRLLLARLAAYDALAAAARIEVARADRFGCRELRDALNALDGRTE
jgi:hypothetical protein